MFHACPECTSEQTVNVSNLLETYLGVQVKYSEVTYDTTFENYTMLTGNIVSLGMGGIICVVTSLIFPEKYDFVSMKQIKMLDEDLDGDKGFTKVRNPIFNLHVAICIETRKQKCIVSATNCKWELKYHQPCAPASTTQHLTA